MSLKKIWTSTGNEEPPTGRKVLRTFRDVSLSEFSAEIIDEIDSGCIQKGINRSQFINELHQFADDETWQRFSVLTCSKALGDALEICPLPALPPPKPGEPGAEDFSDILLNHADRFNGSPAKTEPKEP